MPELLLELLSEEIPARMQARAAADLKALVTGGLVEVGLMYEGAQSHAGPRRLVLSVEGLAGMTAESSEERKGPRVDAPAQAIEGFLRAAGVRLEDCGEVEDKKGRFYVARITKPGRATPDIVAGLVPDVMSRFPWPKSMRWGSGSLRWVRPLQSILCTFDGETVPFSIDGIASGNLTRGHRFMAPAAFAVRRFEDYASGLAQAFVMVDASERAETIRTEANTLAFAQCFEVVDDEGLLAESAGLAEWPVVLMGSFDEAFLTLPPEVISTSIRHHQKCFSLKRRGGDATLANRYLLVANLIARDAGREIIAGNNRVIAARLSDARFFWDQDRKSKLEDLLPKLEGITFHGKLGSQRDRVSRLESLAGEIATAIGADVEQARLAARLCKADLVTGMVGEFPELQGLMGHYYALAEGHDRDVAEAIRDHYKPQGPGDSLPASPVAQAVALADKLDMLWSFWSVDERPTGSRDPFALRRAALGVIRILLAAGLKLRLRYFAELQVKEEEYTENADRIDNLMLFIEERLQIHLREQGARHDLLEAVTSEYSLLDKGNAVSIVARLEALGRFLDTEDGGHLLAGVKRAINIVRIEEKRDGVSHDAPPDRNLLVQGEEKALATAIDRAEAQARMAVEAEDFEAAMRAIARLRGPIDTFFDRVTVNADDPSFRENRLKLLNRIRAATLAVADFSRIEC